MSASETEWSRELKPGSSYHYNEPGLTYNAAIFDGIAAISYNQLGTETAWTHEEVSG